MFLNNITLTMLKHVVLVALVGAAIAFVQLIGADPLIANADPLTAGVVGMVAAAFTRLLQAEATKIEPAVTTRPASALPTGQGIGANMTTAPPSTTNP